MIYSGKTFAISFRNVNVSSKSVKGGFKYEFKGEITEEDYEQFKGADLTGSAFEAMVECVTVSNQNSPQPDDKPKGGPLSQNAARMCQERDFHRYVFEIEAAELTPEIVTSLAEGKTDEVLAKDYICRECYIKSRAELDHNAQAAQIYGKIKGRYLHWLNDHAN